MSEAVIVSLIVAASSVVVAIFGHQMREIKRDTRASRQQVENSHPTNLRDEQDERHVEVLLYLDRLFKHGEGLSQDIRGLRADVGRGDARDETLSSRIHDLEVKD
jgi:predicted Holliday junction resolvase-like endonuclease